MAFTMAGNSYGPKRHTSRTSQRPRQSIQPTIPAGFDQVYKDLMAYNGTFSLILNIRSAILRYGKLTDKQWGAVKKCLAPQPVQDPATILVQSCNVPIVVSPSAARYIAKTHNWPVNPCTLIVTQIKSHDKRSLTLKVKMDWSSNVTACRCCGKTLTDWKSQATGVGPYCVKRTSIQYVRNKADVARFQKEMEDLCARIGEVEVVVKKWHLKSGLQALTSAIESSTPSVIKVTTPDCLVFPLQYCTWEEERRILTLKNDLVPIVDSTTDVVGIHNCITDKTVLFVKRAVIKSDDSLEFRSTGFDNPITLYITK